MNILPINSNFNHNQNSSQNINFKELKYFGKTSGVILRLNKNELKEFNTIKERLSKTKHWDLLLTDGDKIQSFNIQFINKNNANDIHNEHIIPYERIDYLVKISSPTPNNYSRVDKLKFPNQERAKAMMDLYDKQLSQRVAKNYKLSPLEEVQQAEEQLNFLEEAYVHMYDCKYSAKHFINNRKDDNFWIKLLDRLGLQKNTN